MTTYACFVFAVHAFLILLCVGFFSVRRVPFGVNESEFVSRRRKYVSLWKDNIRNGNHVIFSHYA